MKGNALVFWEGLSYPALGFLGLPSRCSPLQGVGLSALIALSAHPQRSIHRTGETYFSPTHVTFLPSIKQLAKIHRFALLTSSLRWPLTCIYSQFLLVFACSCTRRGHVTVVFKSSLESLLFTEAPLHCTQSKETQWRRLCDRIQEMLSHKQLRILKSPLPAWV